MPRVVDRGDAPETDGTPGPEVLGCAVDGRGRAIRQHLRERGIKAVIPEPKDQQGHRKRRGSRGGTPVGLDVHDYKNRNVIERRFCQTKQWRGLATRYDKHAIVYRAAVLIHAAIAWIHALSDTP
ncbi:transposase [Rhodococcus sp. PvR044]|jgi:transposase|uniref:transposase n=1 Tax=unclassified Rhodococcus (in: high G+C Gram-positive bacteria) TaxID=192944 RepID=UPI001C546E9A|nr:MULTISPECIES: transposase [unclassified Rhodococcus (in: high G+C Gram-positive bacteria)]